MAGARLNERGPGMRAFACVLVPFAVVLSPCVSYAGQSFAEAVELIRAGRIREALDSARAIGEPLAALQAEVHVLWAGGDLVGALSAGEGGLERFPADLYLAEQCGQLAAVLGAGERALAHSERLDLALRESQLAGEERLAWEARARTLHDEAALASERVEKRVGALTRARRTVLGVAGFAVVLLMLPWRLLSGSKQP